MNLTATILPYVVAVTGASGAPYAQRLLRFFYEEKIPVHLLLTEAGRQVIEEELGIPISKNEKNGLEKLIGPNFQENITLHGLHDWHSPLASGSFQSNAMIVIPCSAHTLSAIACGHGGNLVERRADIMLKERKKLVVVFREMPVNTIHLEHLLKLSQLGAYILPAMPAFYNHPKTVQDMVDFVVGRVLDVLEIPNNLFKRWKS
jgi:4-hydroxy-3-polyprenylbenzoate decarboxylase